MKMIKGLTIKQWWTIFSIPVLIAAYFAVMSILCRNMVYGGAIALFVFVLSMCIGIYVGAVKNMYHQWRGEIMSRENLVNELTILKDEWGYYRGYIARTRTGIEEIWKELEKNGITRDKE